MSHPADLGSVKEGSYILLEGEPCRVVQVDRSKPGKHGSAKIRLFAIGVFTGSKRSMVGPAESKIEIPTIDKRSGQVISVGQGTYQIMDMETFQTFETSSVEEELKPKLQPGTEVEYWNVLDKVKIMRVKG
ncbi:MAG: translation initiation factor IF-5A [Nitrososphaerota archaeon]|jgi:translation initiation factor 5A|nr:translation initiation factor IF-5A [Nitrososphaerota archaeon]